MRHTIQYQDHHLCYRPHECLQAIPKYKPYKNYSDDLNVSVDFYAQFVIILGWEKVLFDMLR